MTIALVTGASSGIGRSAAVQLAARGSRVILTYNGNEAGAREAVADIASRGGEAVGLRLDVGRSDTFAEFVETVSTTLAESWQVDSIDYLVNNAGFGQMTRFEDTPEDLLDEFYRVILKGPYVLTQKLLPLIKDGGAIVNTTSNSALDSGLEEGYSAYASMKGGLTVLTRYLAKELSGRGIRVNSVAPGPTRTRIAGDAFAKHPEVIGPIAERTALGRVGEADDIGLAIAALLGEDSRWITAQNVEVSGGFNL